MKKILCLVLFLSVLLEGCQLNKEQPAAPPKVQQKIEAETYLRIETTNKLLYYMVKDIVKDRHNIEYMMVNEDDQWRFKYSDDSVNNISNKDLFIYFGGSFEPWADGFIDKLKKGNVSIANCSRGVKLMASDNPRKYGDTEFKDNPYYWMDLNYYKIALANIKNAIQEKDPRNRSLYEDNLNEATKKLDDLDKKFTEQLDKCKKYTFITLNDEQDYFFKYKGIKTLRMNDKNPSETTAELDKRKADFGQFALVYADELTLEAYTSIIETYNIKPIRMKQYDTDKNYIDMLKDNYNFLITLPIS